MRILLAVLTGLHGIIHLIGFIKSFGLAEIRSFSRPVNHTFGILWLLAALLFIGYVFLVLSSSRHAWLIGLIAVLLSQALILIFWKDARYGTILNVVLAVTVFAFYNRGRFLDQVEREKLMLLHGVAADGRLGYTAEDLAHLPPPVQNWLQNSGIIGHPTIHYVRLEQKASLKLKPEQSDWYAATATQLSRADVPGFIWTVQVDANPVLQFYGRDILNACNGEMLINVNHLATFVHAQGEKINEGSLQRFLGEMVWLPSIALSESVSWEAMDTHSARASLRCGNQAVEGVFHFDDSGKFVSFSTLRYQGNEADSERREWLIRALEYKEFEGVLVPSLLEITWRLPEGDWTWLKMEVVDLKFS